MSDEPKLRDRLRWSWKWGRWLAIPLVAGAIYYQVRLAPIAVQGFAPARQTIVAEVMGTGTLEARVSSTVSPKIAGRIRQVFVDQGDSVEQDKLLVQLDDEELLQQVEIAIADLEAAQAALERLNADKARSAAVFAQAENHHGRMQAAHQTGSTTRGELDRAVESLAVAAADVTRAEAGIGEGEKARLAAEKTLEYHRARLADTAIEAPFAGLVVSRHREAGDVAVPGSAVLTLISTEVLWISAWVDETEMSKLATNQRARVVFRSQPDQTYPGVVVRLGRQADRETREFVVDVQVDELPTNWAVGQRAEVYIETDRREGALSIPLTTLIRRDEQDGVFVEDDGKARWKPVTLGLRGRAAAEVRDGLADGEVVLTPVTGMSALTEGQRVEVR